MEDLGMMQVAVDAIVFTVWYDDLKILLIKCKYASTEIGLKNNEYY